MRHSPAGTNSVLRRTLMTSSLALRVLQWETTQSSARSWADAFSWPSCGSSIVASRSVSLRDATSSRDSKASAPPPGSSSAPCTLECLRFQPLSAHMQHMH